MSMQGQGSAGYLTGIYILAGVMVIDVVITFALALYGIPIAVRLAFDLVVGIFAIILYNIKRVRDMKRIKRQ